jgi:signal transduction histidine kinase/ActR/RegA family two-component response regulator
LSEKGKRYLILAALLCVIIVSSIGMHQANMAKNVSRFVFEAAHKHNWFWADGWFELLMQLSSQTTSGKAPKDRSFLTELFRASKEMTDCFSSLRNPAKEDLEANLIRIFGVSKKQAKQTIWITRIYSRVFWEIPEMMAATDHGSFYSRQVIDLLAEKNWYEQHHQFRIIYENMKVREKLYSDLSYKISEKADWLYRLFFSFFCFSISAFFLFIIRNYHIESRKKIETANQILLDKENSLKQAQAIAKFGSWEWNIEKDSFFFSEELCRIFEINPKSSFSGIWQTLKEAVHSDDHEALTTTVKENWFSGKGEKLTIRIVDSKGVVRWIDAMPPEVKESADDGKPLSMIGTVQDITELKQMEDQLRQAQKMEAIGTLAGGVAHDFNNILSGIIGYTELSKMSVSGDGKLLNFLDNIMEAGNRAKNLVQQILTFSRQTDQHLSTVSVKMILKEALILLRASLPSTIEIRQNIKSDALVVGNPTQIHQIIMNLCTNAGYAMQADGGVLGIDLLNMDRDTVLSSQYPDLETSSYVSLCISDTGHGMPPEILERIFDPFFTTKEKSQGTGMGLAVVHGIVKSYHGAVYVQSKPGEGTRFEVFLPLAKSTPETHEDTQEDLPTGTEHILIIDDEPSLVEIDGEMLKSLGYRIVTRTSSLEALELFRAQPDRFDMIITDLTMPNLTGDKLSEELISIRKDIPIIICTGFSDHKIEESINTIGIKGMLMKPIVRADLAQMVRKVLDEAKANL